MMDANALEREAQLAWRELCALIQIWVAQGRVSPEAGTYVCEEWGREVWTRAYLRLRRRATRLGDLKRLDELNGPREVPCIP